MSPATDYFAGFVAAEGCFTGTSDNSRFTFCVGLGATDRETVQAFHTFFGVGRIATSPRRKAHYDDEVQYAVGSVHDLIGVIIPFMDEHLPPSHKWEQYLDWRERLFDFWDHRARRAWPRRHCSVDGCRNLPRAKGLCRHHYYKAYGR